MSQRDSEPPESEEPVENRKERVIHTRVPAVLEQELKRLAENIRVPVSNLVRTILEDAVEMADRAGRGVEQELHKAASNLSTRREKILLRRVPKEGSERGEREGREPAYGDRGIIGFQAMTLAGDARCARCDRALEEGDDAHLGVAADPTAPRVVVCDDCVPRSRGKERPSNKKEKSS